MFTLVVPESGRSRFLARTRLNAPGPWICHIRQAEATMGWFSSLSR